MNQTTKTLFPEIPRGLRAARALLANPDDLPQVFTLLEALSGDTLARIERRLTTTAAGRSLLDAKPDLVLLLEDREALAKLPDGSLGRAYLAFVESEKISAEGIREAANRGIQEKAALPPGEAYVHARMRDSHDLWHAVTGYQGDVLGEVALLAFTFAQTKNAGILVIVLLGLYKTIGAPAARAVILDGYRRGRRAAWLPEQPWEEMLARPLAEIQARLHVDPLAAYEPVRSADLRAAAA